MNKKDIAAFITALKSFISASHCDTIYLHGCQIHELIILSENEKFVIKNSIASRQHEFSAGRYCAKQCLSHYGLDNHELLKGLLGNPIWPKGYTGSITHHDPIALAAVSMTNQFTAIGIDLTRSSERIEDSSLLMSNNEIRLMDTLAPNDNAELLIFNIKEAAIKICSPLLEEYIEFSDLTLHEGDHNKLIIRHPSISDDIHIIWHSSQGWLFSLATFT